MFIRLCALFDLLQAWCSLRFHRGLEPGPLRNSELSLSSLTGGVLTRSKTHGPDTRIQRKPVWIKAVGLLLRTGVMSGSISCRSCSSSRVKSSTLSPHQISVGGYFGGFLHCELSANVFIEQRCVVFWLDGGRQHFIWIAMGWSLSSTLRLHSPLRRCWATGIFVAKYLKD